MPLVASQSQDFKTQECQPKFNFLEYKDIGEKFGDKKEVTIKSSNSFLFNNPFTNTKEPKTCLTFYEFDDKTFSLSSTQTKNFEQVFNELFEEGSWVGRKMILVVSYNSKGNLTIYPQTPIHLLFSKTS